MTNEQQQRQQEMDGEFGDESQFSSLMERTDELITQFFQLRRFISGGEGVHIRPGIKNFIDTDP